MGEEILQCSNLTVGYDGRGLCSGLQFSVCTGDYICVLGQSGVGKSSLAATLMGVEKPVAGEIRFSGGLTVQKIGCLPQDPVFQSDATVWETVLRGCLHRTRRIFVGRREKEIAMENLERLGIASLAKRRFGELSGGGHRRVLLARALCAAEKLLILDEPAYGLDVMSRAELYRQIGEINRDKGLAILVIGTDGMQDAAKVLHMGEKQLFFGTREEYAASLPGKYFAAGRIM